MTNPSHEDLVNKVQKNSKSIALIYSPVDLNEYIVEIISKSSNLFINKKDDISHFLSVEEAVSQAKKFGAKEFFLCVDNTYDECGSMDSSHQFEYIPLH